MAKFALKITWSQNSQIESEGSFNDLLEACKAFSGSQQPEDLEISIKPVQSTQDS